MENCSINPTENCKALAIVAGLEEKLPLQLKNLMYKFSTKPGVQKRIDLALDNSKTSLRVY